MFGRSVMRVAVIYVYALAGGGYPRDIRWLASALHSVGVSVTLFARPGVVAEELTEDVCVKPLEQCELDSVDLYHIFGIFIPMHLRILYRVLDKPVVVSTMGHLMPFHLRRKAVKKAIYLKAVKPILKKVHWFHVFSPVEADSIYRYLGREVQTFEAGLGVFPVPSDVELNLKEKICDNRSVNLLFFGRNDVYQKGIDILLEGFAKAVKWGASVTLTIAGQPWGNSERYIREFIEKEGLGEQVRVLGRVEEKMKWKLLSNADYLVFLSRWDGPPRPIREAIAVGTPVIVSPETNMGHLVSEFGAGIQVPLNAKEVARTIISVTQDRSKLAEHRIGVLKLHERLDWSRVAEDYIRGYEQVLESWK